MQAPIEQAYSSPTAPPQIGGTSQAVDSNGGGESGGLTTGGGGSGTAMSVALIAALKP